MAKRKITPRHYEEIRTMIINASGSLTQREMARLFGISPATINRIANSSTYEEYQEKVRRGGKPEESPRAGRFVKDMVVLNGETYIKLETMFEELDKLAENLKRL